MKIVFYCEENSPANPANYVRLGASGTVGAMVLVSRGLAVRGHEVHVLNRSPGGTFAGVQHHETRSAAEMKAHAARLGPADVFVGNGFASAALLEERPPARRVVYWSHNYVDQRPYARALADGRLDYVVCISENQFGTWWRSPFFDRVCQVYNPTDFDAFQGIRERAVPARRIIFVGAPRACKGFDDAVRVFLAFQREFPDYELAVAGSAALHAGVGTVPGTVFEPDYEKRVLADLLYGEGRVLKPGITLLGTLPKAQLWEHLAASRVLLANPSWTSQPENHSLSVMEAQALGVPVVSTFRGGMPEVVANGRGGVLVRRRGIGPLVAALRRAVGDDRLRAGPDTSEGQRIREKFGVERIAADWEERLARMVAGERFRGNTAVAMRRKLLRFLRLG